MYLRFYLSKFRSKTFKFSFYFDIKSSKLSNGGVMSSALPFMNLLYLLGN